MASITTTDDTNTDLLVARIDVDANLTEVRLDPSDILRSLYREIGCGSVDVVRLGESLDMWVDDFGIYGGGVNRAATRIARRFGYVHQPYFGTAVFAGTDGRGNTIALTADGIAALRLFTR